MGYYVTVLQDGAIDGLFHDAVAAPPPGAVEVPYEVGDSLRAEGFTGKRWLNGVLASAPPPTHAALVAQVLAKARAMRLEFFQVLDGLQVSAVWTAQQITVGALQVPLAGAIETCKQQLRDITLTDLSACTTVSEMEAAIFAAYQAIAAAAPVEIQSAFQSLVP